MPQSFIDVAPFIDDQTTTCQCYVHSLLLVYSDTYVSETVQVLLKIIVAKKCQKFLLL